MPRRLAVCHECRSPLPDAALNTGALIPCPGCGTQQQTELFPAFFRPANVGTAGETIVAEGEAGCFFHPGKKAVMPCAECGRFLCALCDLELNGRHICPGCLESGQRKGRLVELETRRTLYDTAAIELAFLPILFFPVTLLTAPTTLGVIIYGWKKPRSLIPRSRWRFIVAFFVVLAQIVAWCAIFYSMNNESHGGGAGG